MTKNALPGTDEASSIRTNSKWVSSWPVLEQENNARLFDIAYSLMPKYGYGWNAHSVVTLRRQSISRILYYDHLYQKILNVPGVICEFGVQWGATLAQLISLRGLYEPYNYARVVVGFDTFAGFPEVGENDGHSKVGEYSTLDSYELVLDELLKIHESFSPFSHKKKYQLVKGNASDSIDGWLKENPHAIISMAIFDMDLYKPTRDVLEKIIPRLTKGSLLVFDELNCEHFPGETMALNEVLGLNNLSLKTHPHQPFRAWAVFGE